MALETWNMHHLDWGAELSGIPGTSCVDTLWEGAGDRKLHAGGNHHALAGICQEEGLSGLLQLLPPLLLLILLGRKSG